MVNVTGVMGKPFFAKSFEESPSVSIPAQGNFETRARCQVFGMLVGFERFIQRSVNAVGNTLLDTNWKHHVVEKRDILL